MRVEGVQRGRLTDGCPPLSRELVALLVDRFAPGTVPFLASHDDARIIGWVDHVELQNAADLAFAGEILESTIDGETRERLATGRVPVSIEMLVRAGPGQAPADLSAVPPLREFLGEIHPGRNLVAVALSAAPAASGSYVASTSWGSGDEVVRGSF